MDNKLIDKMAMVSVVGLVSLYVLQHIQQVLAPTVEAEYPEPYGMIWFYPAGHIMNVSYIGEEPEYFGEALPGTLDSDAGWRIYRYEYVMVAGDLEVVGVRFASGNTNFDKVWDNRADYEYM